MDRRVEVEVGPCRHLVPRQHQVLRKDISSHSPLIITFYRESTKTWEVEGVHICLIIKFMTRTPVHNSATLQSHSATAWMSLSQKPWGTAACASHHENIVTKIMALRRTWREFLTWSAHHLTPDILLTCFHHPDFFWQKVLMFKEPVQRSPCRHAVEPQARWLNSRGWIGWLGWSWRARPWRGRGRSRSRPSRRARGGRAGRRGSRTGPPSACSPPPHSLGWGSPRPSTGWQRSRIHPHTCRAFSLGPRSKCWFSAKTWSVVSTWGRGRGGPEGGKIWMMSRHLQNL